MVQSPADDRGSAELRGEPMRQDHVQLVGCDRPFPFPSPDLNYDGYTGKQFLAVVYADQNRGRFAGKDGIGEPHCNIKLLKTNASGEKTDNQGREQKRQNEKEQIITSVPCGESNY